MNVQLEKRAQIRELAKKIAGEIVLSQNPGSTIRKWRNLLKISQVELASKLKISPSVISDYESNRRKSPGIKMIRKMVDAMLEIEEAKGGGFFKEFFVVVAIKVTNFKPNLVVFHGIERVDEIALKIAEVEHIPVAVIKDGDVNKTMKALRENFI